MGAIASLFTNPTVFNGMVAGITGQSLASVTDALSPKKKPPLLASGPAAADLGLGSQLQQQEADQEEERRKQKLMAGSTSDTLGLAPGF